MHNPKPARFITSGASCHFYRHGKYALLLNPVMFRDSKDHMHTAHPGLFTDGRSGKIGYYIIGSPFRTEYLEAYILHDWYCAKAKLLEPELRAIVRDAADLQLRNETLPALGAGLPRRVATYRAVRWHAWCHRDDEAGTWTADFLSEDASHTV